MTHAVPCCLGAKTGDHCVVAAFRPQNCVMTGADCHSELPRPIFSRFYARISPGMEAESMADLRRELWPS
jgi:hypothetical protein